MCIRDRYYGSCNSSWQAIVLKEKAYAQQCSGSVLAPASVSLFWRSCGTAHSCAARSGGSIQLRGSLGLVDHGFSSRTCTCRGGRPHGSKCYPCLLYTSDAADDLTRVDLGGRRIIKKKKKHEVRTT